MLQRLGSVADGDSPSPAFDAGQSVVLFLRYGALLELFFVLIDICNEILAK